MTTINKSQQLSHNHVAWIFLVLALILALVNADGAPSSSTHKNDDSIDVSSSIGVSHDGSAAEHSAGSSHHVSSGLVEDLLANESIMDSSQPVRLSPIGPASLSHASVVDSESDLMSAESDSKFSFSKLKRPFARLPFDLRFNTRFLNGPMMASGSNVMPQIHHKPPASHPNQMRTQLMRQPPPQLHRPFPPQGPLSPNHNNNHRGQFQPPTNFGNHQAQQPPIYKSLPLPMPHQQNPQIPKSMLQPQLQMIQHQNGNGAPSHIEIDPNSGSHSDIVHTITEYIETDEDGHHGHNELINDYDRQSLTAPSNDIWPVAQTDLAKIVHLDVKCEKNFMKVSVEFDRPFNGIIFSKGHFSQPNCIHLPAGSGRSNIYFDIRIDSCGTTGNMGPNSLIAYGNVNAGNFFENTVIFQYDPFVQEAWDQARKLRCTWHDQYEKSVSFRPFPVDMVDVVRADFAGDNVGCWMQIQVGRGPWASEVAGIVKIGQTMTMVLAIKDEENKFDMLVRNCVAHDGKRAPIELVDTNGCIVRNKLMSKFTKIKNFGSSASVLSYAHFQAFKFPDSMEVHFQCTIQICKNSCPEQCDQSGQSNIHYINHQISGTISTQNLQNHQPNVVGVGGGDTIYLASDMANAAAQIGESPQRSDNSVIARPREVRDVSNEQQEMMNETTAKTETATGINKEVGVNKVIRVISTGDLSFITSDKLVAEANELSNNGSFNKNGTLSSNMGIRAKTWLSEKINEKICMSSINFLICFVTLSTLALFFCTCSVVMCCRRRSSSTLDGSNPAAAMLLHGHNLKQQKKSAKEASLMNGNGKNGKRSKHSDEYGSQTVIPVMTNGSTGQPNYLSTTSMLSPRVQATANNGYAIYH